MRVIFLIFLAQVPWFIERAVDAFRDMIQAGWRCDVGTYDAVMGALGRL